jgi:hypothetical protein
LARFSGEFDDMSLRRFAWLGPVAAVALAALCSVFVVATPAQAVPHPPPTGPTTYGLYLLNSRYTGDITATRGWRTTWTVPQVNNPTTAWGAIGSWYYNLESGVYRSPDGWFVYYYDDNDGVSENNPLCDTVQWGSGGLCTGALGPLAAGTRVSFTYERCNANRTPNLNGVKICLYVNMNDGAGDRFLAADSWQYKFPGDTQLMTPELYSHDIETFTDSGPQYAPPQIPCGSPTVLSGQQYKNTSGTWVPMTGSVWDFEDTTPDYEYRNVNTAAAPTRWESCTTPAPACTAAAWHALGAYPAANQVTYNGHTWRNQNWANPGDTPGTAAAWQDLGACTPPPPGPCADPAWVSTVNYQTPAVVSHNSRRWRAQWWASTGQQPGVAGVWTDLGPC